MSLYTVVGHVTKIGVRLPVYRWARGSTSLESFHLHFSRVIPGTSANAVNFHKYHLTSNSRITSISSAWNCSRNQRSWLYQPPSVYAGELLEIQHRYRQSGTTLSTDDWEREIYQGFVDEASCMMQDDTETFRMTKLLPCHWSHRLTVKVKQRCVSLRV